MSKVYNSESFETVLTFVGCEELACFEATESIEEVLRLEQEGKEGKS